MTGTTELLFLSAHWLSKKICYTFTTAPATTTTTTACTSFLFNFKINSFLSLFWNALYMLLFYKKIKVKIKLFTRFQCLLDFLSFNLVLICLLLLLANNLFCLAIHNLWLSAINYFTWNQNIFLMTLLDLRNFCTTFYLL